MGHVALLGTNTVESSSTSGTITVGSAVSTGRVVLVSVVWSGDGSAIPTGISASDTRGNSYAVDVSAGTGNSTVSCAILRGTVTTALQVGDVITVSTTSARVRWILQADEVSGLSASPLDQTATNHNPGSSSSLSTGTSGTTTQASEYLHAVYGFGRGSSQNITGVGGWSSTAQVNTVSASTMRGLQMAYTSVSATGTQQGTATLSASAAYAGCLATYKISSPALGLVTGTGTARPLTVSRTHAIGRVTGTGTARALTTSQVHVLGRVTSTGTAQPLTVLQVADMVRMPEIRLEVAFADGAVNSTLLQLDDPTRGKLDTGTLGGGSASAPVWTDISEGGRLLECTVERGSRRVDAPVVTAEPGTLTATLDNIDRRFDPTWLDGPYTQETDELSGDTTQLNSNTGFESGTTSGWFANGDSSFTAATDQVYSGTYAGKIIPDGVTLFSDILADGVSVEAGQTYRLSARVRLSTYRYMQIGVHYFDADGVSVGSDFSGQTWLPAATWTLVGHDVVAPSGAVSAIMDITMGGTPPATDVMWVDEGTISHVPYTRATQVTAMRAVRVLATWDDTVYEVWRGYADQWDVTWSPGSSDSRCVLTATDASKVLSNIDRTAVTPVGGGEITGERVDRILASAGWPATDRAVDAGDSTVQATTLEGDAWSELQTVAASELGDLYVDGGGRVTFRRRRAFLNGGRSTTSQATFGDGPGELPVEDVGIANDDATFFNDIRVTRSGGTEQTAEDQTSIDLYYRKTYRPPDPIVETDAEALSYAQWLLHLASDPESRFTDLTILPSAGPLELWPEALGREIGDRITVIRRPPGGGDAIEREQFIRGVRHEFTEGSWTTTFTLQDATRYGSFFVLDDPTLGVLDANALAY